jgi:hypothetical protein
MPELSNRCLSPASLNLDVKTSHFDLMLDPLNYPALILDLLFGVVTIAPSPPVLLGSLGRVGAALYVASIAGRTVHRLFETGSPVGLKLSAS